MRTIAKYSTVAAAAAAVLAVVAAPAASQETSGTFTVLDQGHVDVFGLAYENGELDLHVHDEETATEYAPSEVVLAAVPESKTTVPAGAEYDFLGEEGDEMWLLSDTHVEGVLFAGWGTEEIAAGDFADDTLTITVHDASGRGDVDLYTVDGFGTPDVLFDSDAGAGSWDVGAASHGHLNWAFSEPGAYQLTVEAEGVDAATGETVSTGEVDYCFWVQA
ncbi:choice-of-anchor M domain-containing protein [Glycomyces buryatensis]|uniref:Surface-anchored protein n=1 Tax=Glycomyces buryatensis TaxID=2570927 RepID=A0A4S8QMW3_9ACTN|nr:choice-of-anchor M domain-containing protein [Glycomyces buryatensis]THV42779.1 hypothetical protein FAB82_04465 [Glycomyces buryatensis]